MGLRSIIRDVRKAWLLKRAVTRLKEARKMGHLKTAAFGLLGALLTAVVAQVTAACPGLLAALPSILTACLGGAITYTLAKRPAGVGLTVGGVVGALLAPLQMSLQSVCGSDFWQSLPTLAVAGGT